MSTVAWPDFEAHWFTYLCRETRWFVTWKGRRNTEEHTLPAEVQQITGQATCPFGDAGAVCMTQHD